MPYTRLFILVEGDDDARFFNAVIVPRFQDQYDHVHVWQYARETNEKVESFLRSIRGMGADYVYVGDIDNAPCVTKKKEDAIDLISGLCRERVVVVIAEIESWYYAGIDAEKAQQIDVQELPSTECVTKEKLESLIQETFDSRIDFFAEALKGFSVSTAKCKNGSFRYFVRRFVP